MDGYPQPKGASVQTPTPPPLTPVQKQQWNQFVDYLDKTGMKGNPALDDKDKKLGQFLFDKYKSQTPGVTINYQDVPRIQADLQDYRNKTIQLYKQGKVKYDDSVKSEDDIMRDLSPVDGWLGSKTSQHKFPVALEVVNNNGVVTKKDYGTDMASYESKHPIYKK